MLIGECSRETNAENFLMVCGLCMTNLFAWRDTDPEKMKAVAEPIGPDNDRWLLECAQNAGMILAAWGKHGSHLGRAAAVLAQIRPVHCLKQNKDASPMHPLYCPNSAVPFLLP
jgi:hypothetical protein